MSLTLADIPAPLRSVQTRPLFVMHLDVAPIVLMGRTPGGDRRVGVVTGGRFQGERLSGLVLDGGADWQIARDDGVTTLDARLMLRTDDGALIGMIYRGLRHGPPEVMAALAKGEKVDPASYYFRMTPTFETASEPYAWLNHILALGTGHRYPDGPIYSVFEVM